MQRLLAVIKALLNPKPDLTYSQLSVYVRQNCGKQFSFLVAGEGEALREARHFRTRDNDVVCIESASGNVCHYRWERNQNTGWRQVDPEIAELAGAWPAGS